MNYILKFKSYTAKEDKNNPSLFVLTGLIFPVITYIVFSPECLIPFFAVLFGTGLSLLFFPKKVYIKFILWVLIGSIAYWLNSDSSIFYSQDFSLLPGNKEICATVTDFRAVGNSFNWLNNPDYVEIKIQKYKIDNNDNWTPCSIKAVAKIKNGSELKYGDSVILSGYIVIPDTSIIEGAFNYKNYLRSIGIDYLFYSYGPIIHSVKTGNNNLMPKVFNIRNLLLEKLCSGINNKEIQAFLAGVIFGCRQNISEETKNIFVNNGTVHILAISGLHVGILALFLLIVFRFLPIQIRFLLIPSILFIYIMLSGFQPSAVRAFIMISVFCLFRAFFLSDKALNNILFAAIILILSNPYIITSAGFQFSFIITIILILSWNKKGEWKNVFFEKEKWLAVKQNKNKRKLRNYILNKLHTCIFAALLAALASAGLTLFYQKLITVIMPLINFIIIPLMFPLFFFCIIKIGISLLFGNTLIFLLNCIIMLITNLIFEISLLGSLFSKPITTCYVPAYTIAAIYILLFLFIFSKNRKVKIISALLYCSIFILSSNNTLPKLLYVKPSGNVGVSFVYIDSIKENANIINLPGNSSYLIKEYLKSVNCHKIESIFLTKTNKAACNNTEMILKAYKVSLLVIAKNLRNSKYLTKIKKYCEKNNINFFIANTYSNSSFEFKFNPQNNKMSILSYENGRTYHFNNDDNYKLGRSKTTLYENQKLIQSINLPVSNQSTFIETY